jgi:hypothetical protein
MELKPASLANLRPFAPGNPGRPKGARNKLGEVFVKALLDDFEEHGIVAVKKVREQDTGTYLRVVAGLLPKQITGEDGDPIEVNMKVKFVRPTGT